MSDAFWIALFAALAPTVAVGVQGYRQIKHMKNMDGKVDCILKDVAELKEK